MISHLELRVRSFAHSKVKSDSCNTGFQRHATNIIMKMGEAMHAGSIETKKPPW